MACNINKNNFDKDTATPSWNASCRSSKGWLDGWVDGHGWIEMDGSGLVGRWMD